MGAVPKRKISTQRKGKRRKTKIQKRVNLVVCQHCGVKKISHQLCRECGKM